jgi:hypothetical protein
MKLRIADNPALQQWWNANTGRTNGGLTVDEMVARVTRVGAYLGPEIVLAVPHSSAAGNGRNSAILLADVTNPSELGGALTSMLAGVDPRVRLVHSATELAGVAATTGLLVIYADQQLLAASTDGRQIQAALAARLQQGGFASTALYQRVSQAYVEGVGWLLAADLSQLNNGKEVIGSAQQLVIEEKTGGSGPSYRAVLGFSQARTGMAAWLAAPGSIGAMEFVSANAYGAAAIVTKDPKLIVDNIFSMLQQNPETLQTLQELQQEHHIDIRYDLAEPLGNEFLVAVDGPILPTPSWKLVIEVNDAARLQNSLQAAVAAVNREAAAHQLPQSVLSTEVDGGRTFYQLKAANIPTEIHYTFWAGYLLVAPSKALLEEAIQTHDTHASLARSDHFRAQLPADGRDTFSGIVYQNLQAMANAIPVQGFRDAVGKGLPTLVCLYGEPDRIMMSSNGVLGTNIASMAGLAGMMRAAGLPQPMNGSNPIVGNSFGR